MRAEVRQTGIIKSGQLAHPPPHLFLLSADTSTGASHSRKERASARIILLLIHFPPLVDLFKESAIVYSTQEPGGKKRKKCGTVFSHAKKVPMHKKQEGSKNTALASSCTCSRRRRRRRRWWNKKSKNVALPRPHYEGITGGSCGGWWPLQGKYEKSSARNSRAGFCTPPPARESIRVQTACIATCRALFAGWHLAAVYVAMHILSSTTRKVVSCSSTLLQSRSFLFPLLEGFTFASEDFFISSSLSSSSSF